MFTKTCWAVRDICVGYGKKKVQTATGNVRILWKVNGHARQHQQGLYYMIRDLRAFSGKPIINISAKPKLNHA